MSAPSLWSPEKYFVFLFPIHKMALNESSKGQMFWPKRVSPAGVCPREARQTWRFKGYLALHFLCSLAVWDGIAPDTPQTALRVQLPAVPRTISSIPHKPCSLQHP